jgi:hypothetical protein
MELERKLPLFTPPGSEGEIDSRVRDLVVAITRAIEASTPIARPCDRSISGWAQECKEAQRMAQRLRIRYQRTRNQDDWEAYRHARNHNGRLIRKTLRDAHRSRVREPTTTPQSLWRLTRWARKRNAGHPFTPPLERPDATLEHDHEVKARMFRDAFFPPPPEVDLSDTENYTYPEPITLPSITPTEVDSNQKHVTKESSRKGWNTCPHPPEITSTAQATPGTTVRRMPRSPILSQHFRQSTTVVIPKPGKKDRTKVKAYRPIALPNAVTPQKV